MAFPIVSTSTGRKRNPSHEDNLSLASCIESTPDSNAVHEVGIGLSDPVQSESRRNMLDLINRLHSTGVQLDIDLPMIAVVGSQSAGKSSLIEAISGITLPRASGTCTRCPTECRLSYSEQPWRCTVSLRFTIDKDGQPLGTALNVPFGETISNKADVEERLKRAQRAILNPGTNFKNFLDGPDEDPAIPELSFSTNCVGLQISGGDVTDLSFCDLPGLIASVSKNGNISDIELVKSLVAAYISKPSCLILLTVACETDFENQGAHLLAKQHDPEGKRTIGVLTKPDRIPRGEEERWFKFIQNEAEPLENGWFSVKQPDSKSLAKGISWAGARRREQEFFSSRAPWSSAELSQKQRFGTQNLTRRLSVILSDLIRRRLPELQEELQNLLKKTDKSLRELPVPPSADPTNEIISMVTTFTHDLSKYIEGTPEGDGLLQSIRPLQEDFRKAIRTTAPDFRPYDSSNFMLGRNFQPPAFLSHEEQTFQVSLDTKAIYLDEVMKLALRARTRELPDNYPYVVIKKLINDVTQLWGDPSHALFEQVFEVLAKFVNKVTFEHFGHHTQGGLHQRVMIIINDVLKRCYDTTLMYIDWLLRVENNVSTLNEHYFSDYKDQFLAYYRGSRQKDRNGSLMERLARATTDGYEMDSPIAKIMSGLGELGLDGTSVSDISKILPHDPQEPALHIMASTRAYFQVAYKRFCDNIPMAIDQELLRGLDWDRGVKEALLKGLGVSGVDGHQHCKDLLQEPPNVMALREELTKKRERLETAKKQLMSLF